MTVLDCLKPLTLSAVGNNDRMLRNKFFVVCNLSCNKCPGFAGGVFAAVIDSHMSTVKESKFEIDELIQSNKIEINSVGNFKEG